jgi:hypothetical protein
MNKDELIEQEDKELEDISNNYNMELIIYEIVIGFTFLLVLKSTLMSFINNLYFEFEMLLIISCILLILIVNDFSPYLSETYIKNNFPMVISSKGRAFLYFFICPLIFFENGLSIKLSGILLIVLGLYSTYRIFYK